MYSREELFLSSLECYFCVYFPSCEATREINTKITLSWALKQFVTRVHYSMSCITTQLYWPISRHSADTLLTFQSKFSAAVVDFKYVFFAETAGITSVAFSFRSQCVNSHTWGIWNRKSEIKWPAINSIFHIFGYDTKIHAYLTETQMSLFWGDFFWSLLSHIWYITVIVQLTMDTWTWH